MIVAATLFCSAGPFLFSQPGSATPDLSDLYSFGDDYFLEVSVLPDASGNESRVAVLARLTYDLLSFRKTSAAGSTEDVFVATPSVFVDAVAPDGVIVDYGVWKDTVTTDTYANTNSRRHFASGSIELQLRPGTYTITYTVDDGTPGGRFTRSIEDIDVPDFSASPGAFGTPIFFNQLSDSMIVASAIDGNAYFGEPLRAFIPFTSTATPNNLRFEVVSIIGDDPEDFTLQHAGTGTGTVLGEVTVGNALPLGNELALTLHKDSVSGVYGALIEFDDGSSLDQGEYAMLLELSAGGTTVADTLLFSLRWVDMPFTLSNPTYAIKALYPIATEEEIDDLLSISKEERGDGLNEYWKKFDPTPQTAYNEKMAEYYRRVDYAFFNFASISETDGAFTDRGKIYILFGPPTDVKRELKPEANPEEIWRYDNIVGREFIFRDRTESGAYRLVEYYDL